MEALAALGFAVVAVDGRGTAGRSKAFHDHSYGDLGNAEALDDHIAAIRELGDRYPWLDTGQVGITGHSAGGFATARALLAHPDFYRVGIALSGNHDNGSNVPMWAEWYHGEVTPTRRWPRTCRESFCSSTASLTTTCSRPRPCAWSTPLSRPTRTSTCS